MLTKLISRILAKAWPARQKTDGCPDSSLVEKMVEEPEERLVKERVFVNNQQKSMCVPW